MLTEWKRRGKVLGSNQLGKRVDVCSSRRNRGADGRKEVMGARYPDEANKVVEIERVAIQALFIRGR